MKRHRRAPLTIALALSFCASIVAQGTPLQGAAGDERIETFNVTTELVGYFAWYIDRDANAFEGFNAELATKKIAATASTAPNPYSGKTLRYASGTASRTDYYDSGNRLRMQDYVDGSTSYRRVYTIYAKLVEEISSFSSPECDQTRFYNDAGKVTAIMRNEDAKNDCYFFDAGTGALTQDVAWNDGESEHTIKAFSDGSLDCVYFSYILSGTGVMCTELRRYDASINLRNSEAFFYRGGVLEMTIIKTFNADGTVDAWTYSPDLLKAGQELFARKDANGKDLVKYSIALGEKGFRIATDDAYRFYMVKADVAGLCLLLENAKAGYSDLPLLVRGPASRQISLWEWGFVNKSIKLQGPGPVAALSCGRFDDQVRTYSIVSAPSQGFEVYLGNAKLGLTPCSYSQKGAEPFALKYLKNGAVFERRWEAGEAGAHELKLEADVEPRYLSLRSSAKGAVITIDGKSASGKGPFTVYGSSATVEARAEGYLGVKEVIAAAAGETVERMYDLKPDHAWRREKAWDIGLYLGGAYGMGSPATYSFEMGDMGFVNAALPWTFQLALWGGMKAGSEGEPAVFDALGARGGFGLQSWLGSSARLYAKSLLDLRLLDAAFFSQSSDWDPKLSLSVRCLAGIAGVARKGGWFVEGGADIPISSGGSIAPCLEAGFFILTTRR
jgi:hypothetical protein